jgi:hypothetical protein
MKLTPQLMKAIGDTLTAELTREGLDVQKITLMGEDLGLMITVRVMPGVDLKALCVNGTILWKELIVFRPHVLES